MQIVNGNLIYSKSELNNKSFGHPDIQKMVPKGKYHSVKCIEDIALRGKIKVQNADGTYKIVEKTYITPAFAYNREKRRARERANGRLKGHKLDHHHKLIAKRRKKKNR